MGLGYLPEAMMNYLARLGLEHRRLDRDLHPGRPDREVLARPREQLPASHDPDKLFWIQGEWMKTLSAEQKVAAVMPFLERRGPAGRRRRPRRSRPWSSALGDRLKIFSDIVKLGRYFFTEEITTTPTP